MKIILDKKVLIKVLQKYKNIGFVPTMGAIHKGHISMIKKCKLLCNKTVVSIFINKPQFNKKKDFMKYPREINKDISILNKTKFDYWNLPKIKHIYRNGQNKKIIINSFEKKLCGKFRPGHFKAVIDVIDRFIKIIKPDKIFFGEKDYQQLILVENFLQKKNIRVNVIKCKTIREKNGVALSSRNSLLKKKDYLIASKIYHLIKKSKISLIKNKISVVSIKNKILDFGVNKIDYIEILDVNKLNNKLKRKNKFRIFIAYYLNSVRLIDNI